MRGLWSSRGGRSLALGGRAFAGCFCFRGSLGRFGAVVFCVRGAGFARVGVGRVSVEVQRESSRMHDKLIERRRTFSVVSYRPFEC